MNPLPVSSKRLEKCTVQFSDARLANGALLPLFDRRGVTARILLVSGDTGEYRVADWRPDLVYVPLFGAARVDASWATRQRAAGGPLWYCSRPDAARPFVSSVCDELGHGNCAGLLPKAVAGVYWRRDLSRIMGVWLKKKGGVEFGRWKPDWLADLPPRPKAEASMKSVRGWVLDPIWMR